ncbi:protein YceG like [bacterium endosymbiont of Mortierella elongata FMR23-6]|nr:protein YceG like [bacterium endosymbiont of Mortierella elongata FMR23-6]
MIKQQRKKRLRLYAVKLLCVVTTSAVLLASGFFIWANLPLRLAHHTLDVTIKASSGVRSIVAQLRSEGLPVQAMPFEILARLLKVTTQLKAGNYEFKQGVTSYQVLQKIAQGDVSQYAATVVEGWTFAQMRTALAQHPALTHDVADLTDAQLMQAIGARETQPEGLFFPDTYFFEKNASELGIYRRAYELAQERLMLAWTTRAADLPYKTPYQVLIVASLIEKETGLPTDRPFIAAVFANRLRIGMALQTDPSIIYGLANDYTGRLRKKDLKMDGPYNTYTRPGLPPTPIALPGQAALDAATRPGLSAALYFVSRGDGTSEFSNNLADHNRAVDKFIRGMQ